MIRENFLMVWVYEMTLKALTTSGLWQGSFDGSHEESRHWSC